jgi:small-conductance mechanosensitive channel
LGLSAVGIDLTALSVLGGAIGVGIGLGLQKLAANYVSGFMVLAERSVRIGDMVRVGGVEGRVSDIRARYTVIRSLGGVEAIVPNETLMTSTVENLSLSDTHVYQTTAVSVTYDADVALIERLLTEAALEQPRVLRDPPPAVLLSSFGADGLDFTVGYWLGDPQNGLGRPRSDINRAILQKLREHGVEIPYPQRVLHVTHGPGVQSYDPTESAEVSPRRR